MGGLYYTYYGTEDNEICNNIFLDNSYLPIHFSGTNWDSNTIDYNLYDPFGGYKFFGRYVGAGSTSSSAGVSRLFSRNSSRSAMPTVTALPSNCPTARGELPTGDATVPVTV